MIERIATKRLILIFGLLVGVYPQTWVHAKSLILTDGSPTETQLTLDGTLITVTGYNPSGVTVSGSVATITAGGEYRATGTLTDGMIEVNTVEAVTLTLDGVTISDSTGPAIAGTNAAMLNLVLADGTTNTLSDAAVYSNTDFKATVFSNDPLQVSGSGALTITGLYKHGIASDDNLIISGGTITITSTVKDGLHANDDITITDGNLTINQSESDGLESENTLTISGGTLTISTSGDGLKSAGAMVLNGGDLTITAGSDGIDSKDTLMVGDASINVTAADNGLAAADAFDITGGQTYGESAGDAAISSDVSFSISGGTVVAIGAANGMGLYCGGADGPIFTGGTLVATGGSHTTPSASSTQFIAILDGLSSGSIIHIGTPDTGIMDFVVPQDYNSLIYSSASLSGNTVIPIFTGGSLEGGTSFYGLYTGATYSPGRIWAFLETTAILTPMALSNDWYLPVVEFKTEN